MPQRNFEIEGSSREVIFEELEIDEAVVIKTKSGSIYRFLVKNNQDRILVTVERSSEHNVIEDETTRWEQVEPDCLFDLRGSCRAVTNFGGATIPTEPTEGRFVVGERAWLGTELNGVDKTLITSIIEELQTVSPV